MKYVFVAALAVLLTAVPVSALAAPLAVDHTNFDAIDRMPRRDLQEMRHMTAFFAHASVGANIVDGMQRLHEHAPDRYPLEIANAGPTPSATKPGVFYEFNRGNPGAAAKITLFEQYVAGGWHDPAVNVVIDKFCYIDTDADFGKYISSMAKLERSYPGTTFVYATMPLTTQHDADNSRRELFNDNVRRWAAQHGKILLDIADIEAWSANGRANTYPYSGRQVQAQCAEWSSDGGHLNPVGETRIAKAMYSLVGLIASNGGR